MLHYCRSKEDDRVALGSCVPEQYNMHYSEMVFHLTKDGLVCFTKSSFKLFAIKRSSP